MGTSLLRSTHHRRTTRPTTREHTDRLDANELRPLGCATTDNTSRRLKAVRGRSLMLAGQGVMTGSLAAASAESLRGTRGGSVGGQHAFRRGRARGIDQ